jgi:hypothetical protein
MLRIGGLAPRLLRSLLAFCVFFWSRPSGLAKNKTQNSFFLRCFFNRLKGWFVRGCRGSWTRESPLRIHFRIVRRQLSRAENQGSTPNRLFLFFLALSFRLSLPPLAGGWGGNGKPEEGAQGEARRCRAKPVFLAPLGALILGFWSCFLVSLGS